MLKGDLFLLFLIVNLKILNLTYVDWEALQEIVWKKNHKCTCMWGRGGVKIIFEYSPMC